MLEYRTKSELHPPRRIGDAEGRVVSLDLGLGRTFGPHGSGSRRTATEEGVDPTLPLTFHFSLFTGLLLLEWHSDNNIGAAAGDGTNVQGSL